MGSVTAGLVVITGLFLLTAYCMRTRALERRVKAMDTFAGDPGGEESNAARQQNKPWAPAIQEIPGQLGLSSHSIIISLRHFNLATRLKPIKS